MTREMLVVVAAAALAGCGTEGAATAEPERAETNDAAPPSATAENWGQWFTRDNEEGRWAGYGAPFSEAAFSARCEGERLVFNTTEMPPSGPGTTTMRLSFGGSTEAVQATASEDGLPSTDAPVPADAPWLSRLANASGELTVTVGGSDPLMVPIAEPLKSLIRDCGRSA